MSRSSNSVFSGPVVKIATGPASKQEQTTSTKEGSILYAQCRFADEKRTRLKVQVRLAGGKVTEFYLSESLTKVLLLNAPDGWESVKTDSLFKTSSSKYHPMFFSGGSLESFDRTFSIDISSISKYNQQTYYGEKQW